MVGVNVYNVVAELLSAGVQIPVTPLLEVVGNGDSVSPAQIDATCVNVGVTIGLTVMVILVVLEH